MQIKPLILTIKKRKGNVFSGEVDYVSSVNDKGKFDVLPQHVNFIALIQDYVSFKVVGGNINTIKISSAIMLVYESRVDVYLSI